MRLPDSFYERTEVVTIARELLGKLLVVNTKGVITSGWIVETEAYSWTERGCHAYGGKMTERNKIMFASGGHAYVYLCYGMHHLFNVVTNVKGIAEAVLIRAVEPVAGVTLMQKRRGNKGHAFHLTSGPGKLTQAMGIDRKHNGKYLRGNEVWIEEGQGVSSSQICSSKRIGVDYAGKDAELPWRFTIANNKWISVKV
jgi:DNA-3-methyladenine glycosylase